MTRSRRGFWRAAAAARRPRARSEWRALGAGSPRPAASSATRAGLESIQIRPNVHVIFGAGGNVTVHVGEDGLIVVDTGSTEMARSLLDAIKAISPRPIRMIVNTSADLDHVGGNAVIGGAGIGLSPDPFGAGNHATVLAHENVLLRMSALGANGARIAVPDAGCCRTTRSRRASARCTSMTTRCRSSARPAPIPTAT